MIHSEKEILDWLLAHCEHDRVLYNALTNHQEEPLIRWIGGKWLVAATLARTGCAIFVRIVPHSVTGEPHHYYRIDEHADA